MNQETFIEYTKKFSGAQGVEAWNDAVENFKAKLTSNATWARKDADNLEALRSATFGKELESREIETLHREDFTGQRICFAYDRQRELKEQGIKSTVRRNKYNEITLTFRK